MQVSQEFYLFAVEMLRYAIRELYDDPGDEPVEQYERFKRLAEDAGFRIDEFVREDEFITDPEHERMGRILRGEKE